MIDPKIYKVRGFNLEKTQTRKGEDCLLASYYIDDITVYREYLMIHRTAVWAKKHIDKYNNLVSDQWQPGVIEVTPGKNSKYPNIKIVQWDVMTKKGCRHVFIFSDISPTTGQKYTFCENCEEILNV